MKVTLRFVSHKRGFREDLATSGRVHLSNIPRVGSPHRSYRLVYRKDKPSSKQLVVVLGHFESRFILERTMGEKKGKTAVPAK